MNQRNLPSELFFGSCLLLLLSGCNEDKPTSVSGYVYDTTQVNNVTPLEGAQIKVGIFAPGGFFDGSSAIYGTALSDENGYYRIDFKAEEGHYDMSCYKDFRPEVRRHDVVVANHANRVDFSVYRSITTFQINFTRVPPFTDTLVLLQYNHTPATSNPITVLPIQQNLQSISTWVTGGQFLHLKWKVKNITEQVFDDSVFCPKGDTTIYTITY